MAEADATLRAQLLAFAHHVRDPATHPPPPGIEDHRLRTYRTLIHAGLAALLGPGFPVVRQVLGDDAWRALVARFLATHRCATPLFTRVAREFVAWLAAHAGQGVAGRPWLAELAHHEWVELDLQLSDAGVPAAPAHRDGAVGDDDVLRLSPLARVNAYAWPVHRIGPSWQPEAQPQAPTLLLARRDAAGDVRFAMPSPIAFRLLQLLPSGDASRTVREVLQQLAAEAGADADDAFMASGRTLLAQLRDDGTVLQALC